MRRKKPIAFVLLLLYLSSFAQAQDTATAPESPDTDSIRVLVYSNTAYYRYPEVPAINRWLVLLGHEHGITVDVSEKEK